MEIVNKSKEDFINEICKENESEEEKHSDRECQEEEIVFKERQSVIRISSIICIISKKLDQILQKAFIKDKRKK